jgi:transposase
MPVQDVDAVVEVRPQACGGCGGGLSPTETLPVRHQVWELPEQIRVQVTEYRLHALFCPCCNQETRAELPDRVPNRAFGPRVQGLVGYLSGGLRLSDRQIQESLRLLFGLEVALGSVTNLRKDLAAGLETPVEEVLEFVRSQEAVHIDETTWWNHTERWWLWTAATPEATVFQIRPGRGKWEAQEILGEDFRGGAVTDRLYSYDWLGKRQLCWAHLVRDFRRMAGRAGLPGLLGRQLEELGDAVLRDVRRHRRGEIERSTFRAYASEHRRRVHDLLEVGRRCGHPKTAGTCKDILKKETSLWTYLRDPAIEPTNNAAERAVRPAVLWRKTRRGTQSEQGKSFVERILTAVTTLKQQGRCVLTYLSETMTAFYAGQLAPSLLPT